MKNTSSRVSENTVDSRLNVNVGSTGTPWQVEQAIKGEHGQGASFSSQGFAGASSGAQHESEPQLPTSFPPPVLAVSVDHGAAVSKVIVRAKVVERTRIALQGSTGLVYVLEHDTVSNTFHQRDGRDENFKVTPKSLRMRKILLDENDRKKAGKFVMEQ